jgi:CRP-like cAMP-binding protein
MASIKISPEREARNDLKNVLHIDAEEEAREKVNLQLHPRLWPRIVLASLKKNFPDWPDTVLESLRDAARIQTHLDAALIYAEGDVGDHLLLIVSGSLELSIGNAEGRRVIMNYLSQTEISNLMPVLDGGPVAHEYRAHGKTVLAYIPRAVFLQQMERQPQLMSSIIAMLCMRNRQLQDYAGYLALATFRSKLAARLLYLARKYGRTTQDGIDIDIKLSQENLASLLATSRQSINKELRWMVENNIVAIEYSKVTIFDLQALEHLSAV